MLKFIIIIHIIFLGSLQAGATNSVGCNLGNQIYPNATGKTNASGVSTYNNTSPITIRWDPGDPNCGILSTKISNSTTGCEVIGNNWGVKTTYNPADNSCTPIPAPLDDYIWMLLIPALGFGGYSLYKKFGILNFNS